MKKEESFLLLSLNEAKAKKVAQVVTNESCRKILEYLSKVKDSTESDISKKLNIPISTVHYNLKQLLDVKLVDADEYHYSDKGKEVNHYSLANKYIIIAPKEKDTAFDKLKNLLPAVIAVIGVSFLMWIFRYFSTGFAFSIKAGYESADMITAPLRAAETAPVLSSQGIGFELWFLLGGIFTLLVIFIYDIIKK